MVCGRLCKTVDTMCQTNGNMLDKTYAYSCSAVTAVLFAVAVKA